MSDPVHWIDKLANKVEAELKRRGSKEVFVFNGGLSVSGLQHIGRLRGEVLIPEAVRRVLEKRGYRIKQLLTLYTQDPWKGKREQRAQFRDPEEARKYVGWPLFRVPDPYGCHNNWVEHYWSDFGPFLAEFTDGRIEVITTTELYSGPFKRFILEEVLPKKIKIIDIINKYRGRKPYPKDWIPVEPICGNCGRIDKTVALKIYNDKIYYRCKNCGYEGETDLANAKLNWRIEWAGIWKILDVDFEPYGKDHATPGGSRDSCVDLAKNVFGFNPPIGEWYEWVAIRLKGKTSDMTSSGFVGITPREWLEIAHPQILRFIYFYTDPHKKVVIDLERIPQYYDQYYKAERIYFGVESANDPREEEYLKRTYELSHPKEPPATLPTQIPYTHAAILSQLVGPTNIGEAVKRLRRTGHIREALDEYSLDWLKRLLVISFNWVRKYAPDTLKVSILEQVNDELIEKLEYKEYFCKLATLLERTTEWTEDAIKEKMIEATSDLDPKSRRNFYKEFYMLFTGRDHGPRAAPLLSLLPKEFVVKRLKQACK